MPTSITAAAGAAAGTSPPAPVIQTDSRDDSAIIWCGTGTSPTTGVFCTVTLGANYSGIDEAVLPKVLASFIGANAHAAGLYVSSVTTRTVVISAATAPTASQAATSSGGFGIVLRIDT